MVKETASTKEKKVEYIELIYDLIFVYIIGRNNLLLHSFENGFVTPTAFMAYIMTTLAIIQIWNYTTYYVNIYGRHDIRCHIFLFINMFLLYFIGEVTRTDWQNYHLQYHIAWALILANIGIQYLFELQIYKTEKQNRKQIFRMTSILFAEAIIVAADIPLYMITNTTWLSFIAILFGMFSVFMFGQKESAKFVDFPHLSERAMLYVVFTFGEMIIGISSYFEGEFSLYSTYFAFMAFIIVVGLFLSYGMFYDHIINRTKKTNGLTYMLLHILIIFSLNNITNGLEFMREDELLLLPKNALFNRLFSPVFWLFICSWNQVC
jgi:low temperature requirement protein LtrA